MAGELHRFVLSGVSSYVYAWLEGLPGLFFRGIKLCACVAGGLTRFVLSGGLSCVYAWLEGLPGLLCPGY